MRFSTSAIFVIAAAALSIDAAVIPRNRYSNYVERDAVAAAPAVAGVAREVQPVGYKRMHARDFHTARRSTTASDENVAKREPAPAPAPAAQPEVIQVYKRNHPRDFPKRDNVVTKEVKRDDSPAPAKPYYKRRHARDFSGFKRTQA